MLDIIDVTLRDGGHAVSFDWPLEFSQEYYRIITQISEVKLIELGYWGQTAKSNNTHYNLDYEKVEEITQGSAKNNVSVMIDYHYCSHNLAHYPTAAQNEVGMIRMCSRKRDLPDALSFLRALKKATGLQVSLNVFNISNYSHKELHNVCRTLSTVPLDYVYFADTHGALDLFKRKNDFTEYVKILEEGGIKAGMHLHDHGGKAYFNFSQLSEIGFASTDASTRGMGKGVGNLKLEYILDRAFLPPLLEFISGNQKILTMKESPYGLLTAVYSITDYYAYQAQKHKLSMDNFDYFCQSINGIDKDVYNEPLLTNFLKRIK
jgi:4-hydroxy 2-oxovalerate aldolase